ncbi:MAG: undecaprenyl-diphosphate phosphatase [Planctomycetes bacterium]|nr:undecaprenyl-diphosphate phosphatase [Planctomycetota bacterium]MCB9904154.1 undecaprenyl-diphosphate phosphatase [Planctomycetota bacterium]
MSWWQALILGLVEGLTEYLPVSSTGHLILFQRALGIAEGEAANAYAICIQAGAIVAVLGLYRARVASMFRGLAGRDDDGRRLLLCIVAGFLPAAVLGLAFNDWIEAHLFGLWPTVGAWFVGGVAILAVRGMRKDRDEGAGLALEQLAPRAAFLIGLLQCVAMWPGTSRSLVTIVGGVLVGLRLSAAVEFSFLLGVVTLCAATGYAGLKSGSVMLENYGPLSLAVGFVAAWLAAVVSVRWMVAWLQKHGMAIFGWYRIALAAAVALWMISGGGGS